MKTFMAAGSRLNNSKSVDGIKKYDKVDIVVFMYRIIQAHCKNTVNIDKINHEIKVRPIDSHKAVIIL
uniref:Uncharacterized protein n=1 Tax=Arion vulgaris TaxID=1028688 RepID=A0A0B6ZHU0_9EUPU